jgi:hypothetical protein
VLHGVAARDGIEPPKEVLQTLPTGWVSAPIGKTDSSYLGCRGQTKGKPMFLICLGVPREGLVRRYG